MKNCTDPKLLKGRVQYAVIHEIILNIYGELMKTGLRFAI